MATFIGAFPVLPGKDDDARKFAQETMGRSEEFSASQKRGGVTKEEWSLQQSPMGSLVLVHFETNDVEKAFATMAQRQYGAGGGREQCGSLHGPSQCWVGPGSLWLRPGHQ